MTCAGAGPAGAASKPWRIRRTTRARCTPAPASASSRGTREYAVHVGDIRRTTDAAVVNTRPTAVYSLAFRPNKEIRGLDSAAGIAEGLGSRIVPASPANWLANERSVNIRNIRRTADATVRGAYPTAVDLLALRLDNSAVVRNASARITKGLGSRVAPAGYLCRHRYRR